MAKEMVMYDGKVWGEKVSVYGLEKGYLDYRALAHILGDVIHNDNVREVFPEDWEVVNGEYDYDFTQDFIITRHGYDILKRYTDELVFYNDTLEMYIWGITHFGTSWDYVLTDIKLVES